MTDLEAAEEFGKIVEGDEDFNQMLSEWHLPIAQVLRASKGVLYLGLIAFSIYTLVAWNIKLDVSGQSLADSTYSHCVDALPAGIPHADRICTTFIAWYESQAILLVLIPVILEILLNIPFSLDLVAKRTYNDGSKEEKNDVYTSYKNFLGINASVNSIEQHGLNPGMHLMRIPLMISFWMLNTVLSTNHNVTAIGLTVVAAFSYCYFGWLAAQAAERRRPTFDFAVIWFGQLFVFGAYEFIIGYYDSRVYIEGADHYVAVVWVSGLIFLIVMIVDLLWDLITLSIRNAALASKKNADGPFVMAKTVVEYERLTNDSDEAESVNTRIFEVHPIFPATFFSNWGREVLFETCYAGLVLFAFIYHMENGLAQIV